MQSAIKSGFRLKEWADICWPLRTQPLTPGRSCRECDNTEEKWWFTIHKKVTLNCARGNGLQTKHGICVFSTPFNSVSPVQLPDIPRQQIRTVDEIPNNTLLYDVKLSFPHVPWGRHNILPSQRKVRKFKKFVIQKIQCYLVRQGWQSPDWHGHNSWKYSFSVLKRSSRQSKVWVSSIRSR